MRPLAILVLVAGVARAEQPCEPSPELQSAIAAARGAHDASERLKKLVGANPDDVFAHEAYADQVSMDDYAAARDRYKALHQKAPGEPRWTYLYARLLSYASAKEGLALTEGLDYPRVHFLRAQRLSAAKDLVGAKQELDRYQAACPNALDAWPLRLHVADKKSRPGEIGKLAATIQSRTDPAALSAYATLWKAEFQAVSPSRHPVLRRKVAADLERMRANAKAPDPGLLRTFEEGYKLTSNADGQAWVKTQAAPDSHAFMEAYMDWSKAHPYPKDSAPRAEVDAFSAGQFAASAEWVKKFPTDNMAWSMRLSSAPHDLALPQLKAICTQLLALDPDSLQVAGVYAERGIDVAKVPAMVQRYLAKSGRRWASQRAQPDRFQKMEEMIAEEEKSTRYSGWSVASMAYGALRDLPKLSDVVGKMKTALDLEKPDDEMHKSHEAAWWQARARLAIAENKKADALGYFLKARAIEDDDDGELKALWKDLGGSEDGFAALPTRASDAKKSAEEGWKKKALQLPALALTDLAGRTWKSSDLKGKTVLLVTWATWCGPCKEELPHFEKLYQQTKKRGDLVIASLNVDFDVGLVEPFMKEHKYSFPVLLSSEWASEQRGGGIPLGWIADRTLTVRLEKLGYDPGSQFVEETLKAIDQVAKARE